MRKVLALALVVMLFTVGCQETPDPGATPENPPIETADNPVEAAEPEAEEAVEAQAPPAGEEDSPAESEEPSVTVPERFVPATYALEPLYPSLSFDEPLAAVHDGVGALHIVERRGLVRRLPDDPAGTMETLLDLTDVVSTSGQEMGLLGLDFHPDFEQNGYFYVNYTDGDWTVISRFEFTGDLPVDTATEKEVLSYAQPYANHNGGTLLFGEDGYLYISSGDGGSGGDPQGNAQDLGTYLGKILRIDVDTEEAPYLVPEENPFVDTEGALPEIFAYGLRNPWKFSFDRGRDLLIAADVGQGAIEEIDIIEKGGNYGWNLLEGTQPYSGDPESLENDILPIYEYTHDEGRSITGGHTYYGEEAPSLTGVYVYGDFISGRIWGLWIEEKSAEENHLLLDSDLMISSFGLDGDGEIVVVDFEGGLYRLSESAE